MIKTLIFGITVGFTAQVSANNFRVTPYIQHPSETAMSLLFLTQEAGEARISWWEKAGGVTNSCTTTPRLATELDYLKVQGDSTSDSKDRYGAWVMPFTVPWQHRCRIERLRPGTRYGYVVEIAGAAYTNEFTTVPRKWRDMRFVYFSDSETEPADNDPVKGLTTDWTDPRNNNANRKYYATQTEAYAANLRAIKSRAAELIVMAGDLAQKGSKQVDWDEFWRHNAGQLNDPAGSIPIMASPGNHDYWAYTDNGNTGINKYLSYFEYEPNDAEGIDDERQRELFHRLDYGPVTFIFLDLNNGWDNQPDDDTNLELWRDGAASISKYGANTKPCPSPDYHPGSPMYEWLERQLKSASERSPFIFVVSHQCPYSVGYHNRINVTEGKENLSAVPLRKNIVPLCQKYGVTAMLCGHDEMMEHSIVDGMHVWDMGIAGDGLRGGIITKEANPWQVFRADVDAPEVWQGNRLVAGGKHYGHLEVTIARTNDGEWQARFEPVYMFAVQNEDGSFSGRFERRVYDDVVTIKKAAPKQTTELGLKISVR